MIKASLIIPTYNEAKNISLLIAEIFQNLDREKIDLEIIIVDDNSPDQTAKVAEDLAVEYPIRVVKRAGKLGLGTAVIEGFKHSQRDYLGVMDGDLSHDPVILNDLILSLTEHDIAMGSRFVEGSHIEKWNWWRKVIAGSGMFLTNLLTGVQDPLSGYFFLKREVIEDIRLKTIGYKILFEILVKGRYQKIKELSYTFRMRKYSASKLNYKEFLLFFGQIIKYSFVKMLAKLGYGKRR